ncbi:MAG: GNAT family N-acetyltransferase [Oscillospiraceae bacterium]
MVINIENVTATAKFSGYNYSVCSEIAGESEFTSRLGSNYFRQSAKERFMSEITVDRATKGVCVCSRSMIPDSCEVEVLCVDKGYKRSGLGRKLLSHALRNMRTLRYKRAFLWVNTRNTEAVSFFQKFGFTADGKTRIARDSAGEEHRFWIDI